MHDPTAVLQDLNDLYLYAGVVEHGGFSAAGRALGIPKSRLSKRVSRLEERLGVRLLQRTTRRFVVTDVGERFYVHCRAVLEEARAAQEAVDQASAEPRGTVRLSCPIALSQTVMAQVLPDFLEQYPKVQVRLLSSDRRVDLIGEGFDIAIRVRTNLDSDATLIMRSFGQSRVLPVASPGLLENMGRPRNPAELTEFPTLSMSERDGPQSWTLIDAAGEQLRIDITPRLICGSFPVLLEAARRGMGVAMLPQWICAPLVGSGELEVLLPAWSAPGGTMHFVYSSRRGLLPAVRALVDFLADRLTAETLQKHEASRLPTAS